MKRVAVFGVFDLLHIGHLNLIREASSGADFVLISAQGDESVYWTKGKYPIIPLPQRMAMLLALKGVDMVTYHHEYNVLEICKQFDINTVVEGNDFNIHPHRQEFIDDFRAIGGTFIELDRTPGVSSRDIKFRCYEQLR